MSWLEPDWKAERPSDSEAHDLWSAVRFDPEPSVGASIDAALTVLRELHVNGGALFARAHVACSVPALDWIASRNRWEEFGLLDSLLASAWVRTALPELGLGPVLQALPAWTWGSSFTLGGELARCLVEGGAYKSYGGPPREAKAIGDAFCDSLFGDRFDQVQVYRSTAQWAPWFQGVAWDYSWLAIDKGQQAIAILCVTDTD